MRFFESILQDIQYALRVMQENMVFSLVAILSLALGIGATTAAFSVLNALLLKPLPVRDPDRLVEVARSNIPNVHTYAIWRQIRNQQDVLSDVFAYSEGDFTLAIDQEKQSIEGLYVSGDYFNTLGVTAIVGRTLAPFDDQRGAEPACVISYGLWGRIYGKSQRVIGQTLLLDGHTFTIVGVAPRRFFGVDVGQSFDVIVPLEAERLVHPQRPALDNPRAWWLSVVGRLKPNVSVRQASARLQALGPAIFRASLPPNDDIRQWQRLLHLTLIARSARNGISYLRYSYGDALWLVMWMTALVPIIACANLANLLLMRSTTRQREIATRMALGASRWRLVRQLLTESITMSLSGAVVGLIVADWVSKLLVWVVSSSSEPIFLDLSWDIRVLGFTAAVTLSCALLFGLAPALRVADIHLHSAIKGSSTSPKTRNRFSGSLLLAAQVSLSMVLVVTSGLLVRTLRALLSSDLGYEPRGIMLVGVSGKGSDDKSLRQAFVNDELLRRLRLLPGVVSAAQIASHGRGVQNPILVVPTPGGPERRYPVYDIYVSPGFFKTRRIPVLVGRDFAERDGGGAPPVAIVSEAVAHSLFQGTSPLGLAHSRIEWENGGQRTSLDIIGIARNANYGRPNDGPLGIVYRPISQCGPSCDPMGTYEIRFTGPLSQVKKAVKDEAMQVDSGLALDFHLMVDELNDDLQLNRGTAAITAVFGLFTVALALVGIYGVTSYATSRRAREIGIRMTLGAQPGTVLRMILRSAMTAVVVGIAFGLVGGIATGMAIRRMLYGVSPADPLTFTVAAFLMLTVAAFAALIPAYHASKADPVTTLRIE